MDRREKIIQLEAELNRIASSHDGKVTFALTDLLTGETISRDPDDVMPTASLIKVPVLVALYQAASEGHIALTDRIRYGAGHRCLGSGVLSLLTPGVEMTVRDAGVLMIIISDNSATNMCVDLVGLERVNRTMRSLGLLQTALFFRLGDRSAGLDARKMSVSTAGEMTSLLGMLARREAVSAEASEDMLRIMRRQDYRHELSRLLPWNEMNMLEAPKQNWVAEKGGSFINNIRTSGAVFAGEAGSFVMSVFTEGGRSEGTGRNSAANVLVGDLGYTAWKALAAGPLAETATVRS
jgi:beta-lactamase class A